MSFMSKVKGCRVTLSIVLVGILICVPILGSQHSPPWAEDYGALYPDGMDSRQAAAHAAYYQGEAGYMGMYHHNVDAEYAYYYMPDDAIFCFVGHSQEGFIVFRNGGEDTFIAAEECGGCDGEDTYFIEDFSSSDINDMLLATYIGCKTALTSSQCGNLLTESYYKGVDASLGFTKELWNLWMMYWTKRFWYRACIKEQDISTAAQKAANDVFWKYLSFGGTLSFQIVGDYDLYVVPARYGST